MKRIISIVKASSFSGLNTSRVNIVLTAILGSQLVLASGLYLHSSRQDDFSQAHVIAGFDINAADTLLIDDGEAQLKLVRVDEQWQISGDGNLPADTQRVAGVLETLGDLQAGLPVATTDVAQVQMDVADDNYQRLLTVKHGEEQLVQLYLGTSPGFRKAHVRLAGEQAIHAANINVNDFDITREDWLDKQLMAFNDVSEIAGDGYTIRMESNAWQIVKPEDLDESHVVNASVADSLMDSLQQLRVTGIYDETRDMLTNDSDNESDAGQTRISLTVQVDDGPVVLSMVKQGDMVYVERDDVDGRFTISNSVFEKLSEVTVETLLLEENEASVN